jgi:hypothetical protein
MNLEDALNHNPHMQGLMSRTQLQIEMWGMDHRITVLVGWPKNIQVTQRLKCGRSSSWPMSPVMTLLTSGFLMDLVKK